MATGTAAIRMDFSCTWHGGHDFKAIFAKFLANKRRFFFKMLLVFEKFGSQHWFFEKNAIFS
jgi:hypothetical protein